MGKRSRVPDRDEDIAKLTLEELNAEIARCEGRLEFAPSAYLKRVFEKRIHWLKTLRCVREAQ